MATDILKTLEMVKQLTDAGMTPQEAAAFIQGAVDAHSPSGRGGARKSTGTRGDGKVTAILPAYLIVTDGPPSPEIRNAIKRDPMAKFVKNGELAGWYVSEVPAELRVPGQAVREAVGAPVVTVAPPNANGDNLAILRAAGLLR